MRGFGEFKGYVTRIIYDTKTKTFTERAGEKIMKDKPVKKRPVQGQKITKK